MPENEKFSQRTNDVYNKSAYRRQTANPLSTLSNVTPEDFLDNLRRIESIVAEITRVLKNN